MASVSIDRLQKNTRDRAKHNTNPSQQSDQSKMRQRKAKKEEKEESCSSNFLMLCISSRNEASTTRYNALNLLSRTYFLTQKLGTFQAVLAK
jgi:hypothetical protein